MIVAYKREWPRRYQAAAEIRAAGAHVFGPDRPEVVRHRMFRDWLHDHPEDRARYENAKRAALPGGGNIMDHNPRKQDTVRAIHDRLFRAAERCRHLDPMPVV